MTQVQQMSDAEINLELALLCGHELITEREDVVNRRQRNDYVGGGVVVLYGNHYIVRANGKYGRWDPCTDPAASLEVQAAAIKAAPWDYANNLQIVQHGDIRHDIPMYRLADMLTATPRQRAEAALMTLRDTKGDE